MKAAVYYGPGDIRVCDRPAPEPRADNLIAEVACCAICGTDLKLATVGHPRWQPSRIVGHELAGRVIHAGAKTAGFTVGDRVTIATTLACGRCVYCALGLGNLCPNSTPISINYDGGFAEQLAIPPLALAGGNVVKVPDEVSDEEAALSEPLSCAINAQEIAGVKRGDNVVIVGGGPLGALHAEIAKAAGAKKVLVTQRSEPRLSLLRKIRGIIVIDGHSENVASRVLEETGNLGADVVIVCAPTREAQEESVRLARKGGAVSFFASLPKGDSNITLDNRLIHYNELRLFGSSDSRPEQVQKAVDLLATGKINVTPIITHRVPLEGIHDGLELMKNKQSLKVIVETRKR